MVADMASRTSRTPHARPRSGSRRPTGAAVTTVDGPNPRQPCPCGSGRRFKHCHGSGHPVRVGRPFEGISGEADLIAMRELVSAATAPLHLSDPAYADRSVLLATILPQLAPALVRADGTILVGLQLAATSDDVSADIGTALQAAMEARPGDAINPGPIGGAGSAGPRLQELLAPDGPPLEVTIHDGFSYWLDAQPDDEPRDEALDALMEQAEAAVFPSVRMPGEAAAYWCRPDDARAHLRWVMTHPEDRLLDALAVLGAAGELDLGTGTKYAGAFRAHGLVAPVWDLPPDQPAEDWWAPAAALEARLDELLESRPALDEAARRYRSKLLSGQVTLR